MKVRELIKLLSELDQEKEIKFMSGGGYEWEPETADINEIRQFEPDGRDKYTADYGENKDFYLIDF